MVIGMIETSEPAPNLKLNLCFFSYEAFHMNSCKFQHNHIKQCCVRLQLSTWDFWLPTRKN